MSFLKDKFYRHFRSLDVDIYIVDVQEKDNGYNMLVHFVNKNRGLVFETGSKIFIKKEDAKNWRRL